MCTAMAYQTKDHYFGRNLDLDCSYGETVTVTPRHYLFAFRQAPAMPRHYAIIGMAHLAGGYPLYYDATNEAGLSMAGLNFPGNAVYRPAARGKDNVTPFELIPWILGQCASLGEARRLLDRLNLLDLAFRPDMPLAPLHWMLSDKTGCLVVEPLAGGLAVADNPAQVLTNNPPFAYQRTNLSNYLNLTPREPENRFAQGINAYKVFWIFFLGSILGVVIETLFCLMTRGHYENRVGVIWGPFNPVYGFGCVALTLGLYFLRFHRDLHILFFGAIIGNAVEYFCSWAQEQVFGSTSWDYSSMPYNINGRICLLYGLFWGILACYWIKNIFPLLNAWILRIPQRIGKALTWVLCVLLCADMALSAWAVLRWVERDQGTPPRNAVERFFDARFGDERMQMLFPNMTFASD